MLNKIAEMESSRQVKAAVREINRKQEEKDAMEEGLVDLYFEFSPEQQGMSFDELKRALKSYEIEMSDE